jgi:hypothetical protein
MPVISTREEAIEVTKQTIEMSGKKRADIDKLSDDKLLAYAGKNILSQEGVKALGLQANERETLEHTDYPMPFDDQVALSEETKHANINHIGDSSGSMFGTSGRKIAKLSETEKKLFIERKPDVAIQQYVQDQIRPLQNNPRYASKIDSVRRTAEKTAKECTRSYHESRQKGEFSRDEELIMEEQKGLYQLLSVNHTPGTEARFFTLHNMTSPVVVKFVNFDASGRPITNNLPRVEYRTQEGQISDIPITLKIGERYSPNIIYSDAQASTINRDVVLSEFRDLATKHLPCTIYDTPLKEAVYRLNTTVTNGIRDINVKHVDGSPSDDQLIPVKLNSASGLGSKTYNVYQGLYNYEQNKDDNQTTSNYVLHNGDEEEMQPINDLDIAARSVMVADDYHSELKGRKEINGPKEVYSEGSHISIRYFNSKNHPEKDAGDERVYTCQELKKKGVKYDLQEWKTGWLTQAPGPLDRNVNYGISDAELKKYHLGSQNYVDLQGRPTINWLGSEGRHVNGFDPVAVSKKMSVVHGTSAFDTMNSLSNSLPSSYGRPTPVQGANAGYYGGNDVFANTNNRTASLRNSLFGSRR